MSLTICPKCSYQRQPGESHIHPGVCPQCGIAYQKYLQRLQDQSADGSRPAKPKPPLKVAVEEAQSNWRARLKARCLEVPADVPRAVFYVRVLLLCALLGIAVRFMLAGIDWDVIGGSFFHNIILPFHEFGHVLFMPFGRFMAILGGSLFQVCMPLGLMLVFIVKQRDNFGASVMLWWSGQSLIDLAPYIADAVERNLPLVGGAGEDSHDWGNLLTMLGMLNHAQGLARFSFLLGSVVMLLALWWMGCLLRLQYQRSRRRE